MLIIYHLSLFDIMLCNCWLGKYSKMKISNFCVHGHEGFFKKCFFFLQKPYRIILGPPKHVLHLVCIVFGLSTTIKTALKVAFYDFFDGPPAPLNGQLMEKVKHYN